MKIDIVIMAHRSRSSFVDYLKNILGDVKVSWDDDVLKLGTWGNCRQAWQLVDRDADYGFVIQDDAILCNNFIEKLYSFVGEHSNEIIFQLFYGDRTKAVKEIEQTDALEKGFYRNVLGWGVAIGLKTDVIDNMISYCDVMFQDMPDDSRIKRWSLANNFVACYPIPSLVDHRLDCSVVDPVKSFRSAWRFVDQKQIPKVFHQIWIGNKPKPEKWMQTWKNIPGYEYVLWDNNNIQELDIMPSKQYEIYRNRKLYYAMSDILRLEILKKYGGIYLDADCVRTKKWQDYQFLKKNFFAVQAYTFPSKHYRIANGVMGAEPDSFIVNEYLEGIAKAKDLFPVWDTIGGTMLTKIVEQYRTNPDIHILEPYWFYPFNSKGYKHPNFRKAIAKHYWGTTHRLY